MKKTRKECEMDTGYTPESISEISISHPSMARPEYKNWTHDQKVEWVYEGLKVHRQKMLGQTKLNQFKSHNCTGSRACFGCERDRRQAYASGGNYY